MIKQEGRKTEKYYFSLMHRKRTEQDYIEKAGQKNTGGGGCKIKIKGKYQVTRIQILFSTKTTRLTHSLFSSIFTELMVSSFPTPQPHARRLPEKKISSILAVELPRIPEKKGCTAPRTHPRIQTFAHYHINSHRFAPKRKAARHSNQTLKIPVPFTNLLPFCLKKK